MEMIAGYVAHVAFWVLLVFGLAYKVIGARGVALFIVLWVLGYIGLPRIAWWTGGFITPWIAVLDIALAFLVFNGDVPLTS